MKKVKIQSLERADSILEVLFRGPIEGWRLQDVVERTGLKPVTALSLLQSLVALRLAEQVGPRGRYRLGPRLLQLGRKVEARLDIITLARPALVRLCQQSGEMVNLLVPSLTSMVVVESLEGKVFLKTTPLKGRDLPMHGTASGKCFLAYSSYDVRAAILETLTFTRMTQKTIGDVKRLQRQLARIRKLGYATEEDEYAADTVAIAVPIIDQGSHIRATLSLHGPTARFGQARRSQLLEMLQTEAQRIGRLLL
ncbi:IclR family transcriptional regulator [Dongia sp.]|uniref:IclR family transcriptional regulator n=1 Tax=Dongia sp. TaxID=1977262 RepID=UPI0035AF32BC